VKGENRVEIRIDDRPFTAYIWPDEMKKPVLYPVHASDEIIITRGYPLNPREGERADHPHHIGHWLNYGDINGYDFWNNSSLRSENTERKYGTIRHEKINKIESGKDRGILETEMSWRDPVGNVLLYEESRFIFMGNDSIRKIIRHTKLKASEQHVSFNDNKEGFFAIRMDRAFEYPTERPVTLVNRRGKPSSDKLKDNTGVNGSYLSSEGLTGPEVWGTRAKWMSLSAEKENQKIAVVILDHPENPGYPTFWHARTYGLFSANPLGQSVFTDGNKELMLKLEPGETVEFKYMIYIRSGEFDIKNKMDNVFDDFSSF
jgi:hypothetical protein